jgi:hypothetical protein
MASRDHENPRAFNLWSGALANHPGQFPVGRIDPAGRKLRIPRQDTLEEGGIFVARHEKQNLPRLIKEGQGHSQAP